MPHYSLGYLALCIVAMFFIGSVVGGMMFLGKKRGTAGTREYEEEPRDVANLRVWKRWLNFYFALEGRKTPFRVRNPDGCRAVMNSR
jgi:hypothetical protein